MEETPKPPNRGGRPRKKLGRPTIFTPEVIDKLEYVFALGGTDLEACLYADISTGALYKYQERNPSFIERKDKLKQSPILAARESVIKGFRRNPDLALKYLERRKKDEFSLKSEVEHSGQASVSIQYVQPSDKPTSNTDSADAETAPGMADTTE